MHNKENTNCGSALHIINVQNNIDKFAISRIYYRYYRYYYLYIFNIGSIQKCERVEDAINKSATSACAHMKRQLEDRDACDGTHDDVYTNDEWHCVTCDETKPISQFYASVIRTNRHICRECANANKKSAACLNRTLLARLRKLLQEEGKSQTETRRLKLSTVDQLLERFGSRSVFSGIGSTDRLTLVTWDKESPTSFNNVVLCTHAEARVHNTRTLADYHQSFVAHVNSNLLLQDNSPNPEENADETSDGECDDSGSVCGSSVDGGSNSVRVNEATDNNDGDNGSAGDANSENPDAAEDSEGIENDQDANKNSDDITNGDEGLEEGCVDDGGNEDSKGAENNTQNIDPPYPPLSPFKRGLSAEVVTWFISNFNAMQPSIHCTSRPIIQHNPMNSMNPMNSSHAVSV